MNDRQLNYFIVIAEEGNLCRAAERLPLSLSALSRQIQSLEEELGATLFIRTASGFELTQAGEALLHHARTLRNQFALARNDVLRAGKTVLGRIDVGCFGSALLNYIPQILKIFTDTHPGVEVLLHTAPIPQQFEYLHQGRTLISFDRFTQVPPEFAIELACQDTMILALPENHPLAYQSVVHFEELRDVPMIGRQDAKNYAPEELAAQAHYGFQLRIVQGVQDMVSAVAMAGCGFGPAIVPSSLQHLRIPNVVYRPLLTEKPLPCNLYCIYRENEQSPALQAMLKTVRLHCAENQNNNIFVDGALCV